MVQDPNDPWGNAAFVQANAPPLQSSPPELWDQWSSGLPTQYSDTQLIQGLARLGYSSEDIQQIMADPNLAIQIVDAGLAADVRAGGSGGGSGGGGEGVALGYAQLGESQRQFDIEYAEGVRQFDLSFSRNNFESDREYELAKEQFAATYAENKRQFDLGYGLDSRSLDLQTELGRGQLDLGRDRLGLDTELGRGELALGGRRLDLDTELGRGRLALDTELGRGELGLGRDRLALDDRLGTGRLNLDTELGRGQLGVNQQGEQRLQRAQVAAERLANRDQELQRTQFVTDVLRKPSDFLARAFLQRGGTSPTGMVTQADIINNLKTSINQFAEGGYTRDGVFTTGEQGGARSTEMLINPTNAPIAIMNPDQTQNMMGRLNLRSQPATQNEASIQPVLDQAPPGPRVPWMMGQTPTTPQMGAGTTPWGGPMPGMGQRFGDNPQFMEWYNNIKAQRALGPMGRLQAMGQQLAANPQVAQIMQQLPQRMQGRIGIPGYANGTLDGMSSVPPIYQNYQRPQPYGGSQNALSGSVSPNSGYNPSFMQPGSTPDWDAATAATQGTINPMTLPNVTQQELVDTGLSVLPPAVKGALFGAAGAIPAARPVANLTLGRLSRLTPGELEALNTQLGVQFNTDLQNEIALLQERFGPVVNRARGRLVTQ